MTSMCLILLVAVAVMSRLSVSPVDVLPSTLREHLGCVAVAVYSRIDVAPAQIRQRYRVMRLSCPSLSALVSRLAFQCVAETGPPGRCLRCFDFP